jgi:hypothetical protein
MHKETKKQTRKRELTQKKTKKGELVPPRKTRKVELTKKKQGKEGKPWLEGGGTCRDLHGLDTDSDFE